MLLLCPVADSDIFDDVRAPVPLLAARLSHALVPDVFFSFDKTQAGNLEDMRSCSARVTTCRPLKNMFCRIHVEPGSDILFMPSLMFTICYGGQVKGWERLKPQPVPPEPPASQEAPLGQPVQAPSQHSTARAAPAQQGGLREQELWQQQQMRVAPRQRAPTVPDTLNGPPPRRQASEQEAASVQTAAALHP